MGRRTCESHTTSLEDLYKIGVSKVLQRVARTLQDLKGDLRHFKGLRGFQGIPGCFREVLGVIRMSHGVSG